MQCVKNNNLQMVHKWYYNSRIYIIHFRYYGLLPLDMINRNCRSFYNSCPNIYAQRPGGLEDLKGLFLLMWEDLKELSRTDSIRLYFNSIRLNLNFYRILIVLNTCLYKSDIYTFYECKFSLFTAFHSSFEFLICFFSESHGGFSALKQTVLYFYRHTSSTTSSEEQIVQQTAPGDTVSRSVVTVTETGDTFEMSMYENV